MQSENIGELISALSIAQGEMQAAAKDSANPFFKSKYADLSSVWNACREPLSRNGLAVTQITQEREGGLYLITTLGHKSGQYMRSEMPVRVKSDGKTNELQVMGACLTYLRRYSLSAIVGVAPDDDDDGNSAKDSFSANKSAQPQQPAIITPSQAQTLKMMLEKCPTDFSNNIMKELARYKIVSLTQLPMNHYEPLMTSLKNKLESLNESQTA